MVHYRMEPVVALNVPSLSVLWTSLAVIFLSLVATIMLTDKVLYVPWSWSDVHLCRVNPGVLMMINTRRMIDILQCATYLSCRLNPSDRNRIKSEALKQNTISEMLHRNNTDNLHWFYKTHCTKTAGKLQRIVTIFSLALRWVERST